MDNQRVFVWAALALVLWLNYMAWQTDYAPRPEPAASTLGEPVDENAELPEVPSAVGEVPAPTTQLEQRTQAAAQADIIRVTTDVLSLDISTRGGELVRADLPRYPRDRKQPDVPVRLFDSQPPGIFVARSGLRALGRASEPTHQAIFEADATEYSLAEGADELVVPLKWTDGQGVTVTKTYTFRRGSYRVDLKYEVENATDTDLKAASYVQLVSHYEPVERSYFRVETYAYRGPAIYDGKAYRRLDIEDEEDRQYKGTITGGWIAALQHHFVAAAVPPTDAAYDYTLRVNRDNDFTLSYVSPARVVPAGGTATFEERLFVGPKLQDQLAATGPELELVADYGKLTIIAQPLFWLLQKVYGVVGNWGWSIVIVTFLIKLAFYKLTAASGRSMAKMRNLAPRIKAIQERYKDDREQLGRQMMELYKREKINPLAGCLPILIQIPFFLAFYWVLLESAEMRQAPFLGWI